MDIPEIMTAIKRRAEVKIPALRDVFYPAPSTVSKYPALVLMSGSPETTLEITHGSSQLWRGEVYGALLTARLGDVSKEIINVDSLIMQAVDAFGIVREMEGLSGYLDHCEIRRLNTNRLISYAGHDYLGAELFFAVKWRRSKPS